MADTQVIRRDFYVYALLRGDCVPFYIGMGIGSRWLQHERRADDSNTHKNNVINKMISDGWPDIPKIKLATGLVRSEAAQLERDLIQLLGRTPAGPLTNKTDGGEGLWNPDEETRRKMSDARRRRVLSQEARAKISAANKGKPKPPMTEAQKENLRRKLTGFKHTDEARQKIAAAGTGRKWTEQHRENFKKSRSGIPMPSHVREAIRQAVVGRKQSPEEVARRVASIKASRERKRTQ